MAAVLKPGDLAIYRSTTGTFREFEGKTCTVTKVSFGHPGRHDGYYLTHPDEGGKALFAFADELHLPRVPATDWEAIAAQHARQRDEAMGQRDTLRGTLATVRSEHRAELDARDAELLKVRNQLQELKDAHCGQGITLERVTKERDEARALAQTPAASYADLLARVQRMESRWQRADDMREEVRPIRVRGL